MRTAKVTVVVSCVQGCRKQFGSGMAMGVVIRSHALILTLIIGACNKIIMVYDEIIT